MGLDISVNATATEVTSELDDWDDALQKSEGLRILQSMQPDCDISVRTGSYGGLHVLRCEYAKLKGWQIQGHTVEITDETCGSHLINHSDCEGWYLPEDFTDPQWIKTNTNYDVSLGSSVRLLSELMEMLATKDKWPEEFSLRWDALFIAALSSVAIRRPIVFH